MAFRKRNIPPAGAQSHSSDLHLSTAIPSPALEHPAGTRPSPLTSALVTSTGSPELDTLLGGHGGLALGASLLIGEHGTTDFAGALLRAFAAEGLLQGHVVHVVGVGEGWARDLPGVAEERGKGRAGQEKSEARAAVEDRMKIAWRYENLGRAGEKVLPSRGQSSSRSMNPGTSEVEVAFSHTFDLASRLTLPPESKIHHIPVSSASDCLIPVLQKLKAGLAGASASSVHRVVIPLLLSPALYPLHAARPEHIFRFLHGLRALLRQYQGQATAMLTLPLSLFPRSSGLVRWMDHLSDGVLEMVPFPYLSSAGDAGTGAKDENPQGMLKVIKLPLTTERGEGGAGVGNSVGEDLAFTMSRRKFVIKPFTLPPMEGDQEAQKEAGKLTAKDVEF